MAESKLHKVDAARHLLDRALDLILDDRDALSALVVAGSAEDILQGMLQRQQRLPEAARYQHAEAAAKLLGFPAGAQSTGFALMINFIRHPFNWTRHADKPTDPIELVADWEEEAVEAVDRAIKNLQALTGNVPRRADEFDERRFGK